MAKVTDWLFVYFLVSLGKLILPTSPQFNSFANCSGQFTMILNYSVQTSWAHLFKINNIVS